MRDLGILDFGYYDLKEKTSGGVIHELVDIVLECEELNFKRYWLGEHWAFGVGWRSSDILISLLCGMTNKIIMGSGGVLLNLHAPIQVAYNYNLMQHLFPGRVELGIASGKASDSILSAFSASTPTREQFKDRLNQLRTLLDREDDLMGDRPALVPLLTEKPPLWVLGSSERMARLAIHNKASLCCSIFHNSEIDMLAISKVIESFKRNYEQVHGVKPRTAVAMAGICSENYEKSVSLHKKFQDESIFVNVFPRVVGDVSSCESQIEEIKHILGVDEVLFMSLINSVEERMNSYRLLSQLINDVEVEGSIEN